MSTFNRELVCLFDKSDTVSKSVSDKQYHFCLLSFSYSMCFCFWGIAVQYAYVSLHHLNMFSCYFCALAAVFVLSFSFLSLPFIACVGVCGADVAQNSLVFIQKSGRFCFKSGPFSG